MEDMIRQRLTDALDPEKLVIINESSLHAHHSSSPQSGQSHFKIKIQAAALKGLSRIEQQRCIYKALGDVFSQGLHALSLEIL